MRPDPIEIDPQTRRNIRNARVVLVVSVVLLVGVVAWARAKYMEPRLQQSGARRIAGRLTPVLRSGDLLFQVSRSRQARAISKATDSPWTHCGVVFFHQGAWQVLEASSTVRWTPLEDWIRQGKDLKVEVRRLDSSLVPLDSLRVGPLEREATRHLGKAYDLVFGWSDSAIYCSELPWKAYRALGIDLGGIQTLKQLDLTSPEAKDLLQQRRGRGIRWEDSLVTPESLRQSRRLHSVTF